MVLMILTTNKIDCTLKKIYNEYHNPTLNNEKKSSYKFRNQLFQIYLTLDIVTSNAHFP